MAIMKYSSLTINCYCSLLGNQDDWGGTSLPILVEVIRSVMEEFNCASSVIPQEHLFVMPDTGSGIPMCSKIGDKYLIFLSARGTCWCQYIYQFAHEYCHYLVNGPLDGEQETTFWFEESICEMASMYFLKKVTERWISWFPVMVSGTPLSDQEEALVLLKQFAPENEPYLDALLNKNAPIEIPLYEWIESNTSTLSEPVYHRDLYNQIATRLYDVFSTYPDLWKVIPFLYRPSVNEYVDFRSFVKDTLKNRVNISIEHLPVLVECLTGEKCDSGVKAEE